MNPQPHLRNADFGINQQTSCGQVEAERQHDFGTAALMGNTKHYDLNALQSNFCNAFADPQRPNWTDEAFAHYIFNTQAVGTSFDEIRQRGNFPQTAVGAPATQYRGQVPIVLPNGGGNGIGQQLFNGTIRNFDNADITNGNSIRSILRYLTQEFGANTPVYLFLDTRGEIITSFSKLPMQNSVILNIINSQANFADGCRVGKNLYNSTLFGAGTRIQCWWCQDNLTIPPYGSTIQSNPITTNYMFHTSTTCVLSDTGYVIPGEKIIRQNWHDGTGNPLITVNDCTKENTINNLTQTFKTHTAPNQSDQRALCWTRKRSGDGFQIWFINRFADILAAGGHNRFYCTYANGILNPTQVQRSPIYTNGLTKQQIRERAFFVTGDWPAFCWAAFCHINVIFVSPKNSNTNSRTKALIFRANPNAVF